jgi:hypothetical protein
MLLLKFRGKALDADHEDFWLTDNEMSAKSEDGPALTAFIIVI